MCKNAIACICVAISVCFLHTAFAQSISQDSLALIDFYKSTQGNKWKNRQNWLSDNPLGSWYGVKVVNDRVVELKITNNNLNGPLPESIGNISELSTIVLSLNGNLNGTIPSTIGKLSRLITLDLEDNQLTGNLPATLGNLTNLQTLALDFNHLSGAIPQSFGRLKNLLFLELESNKNLSGILPDSMGYMVNLREFNGSDNMFTGPIPQTFGNLVLLEAFLMSNNQLTGSIPASLGSLGQLQKLELSVNNLTGAIPASLGSLSKLVSLQLSFNQLTGSIPPSLGNLSLLQFLEVNNNELADSVPAGLAQLGDLQQLDLHDNRFTFAGMEQIAPKNINLNFYAPQANKHVSNSCGTSLSVSVHGTPSNNTFKWYNGNTLVAVKTADSTFTPAAPGNYYVIATNAIAKNLVLHSDTVTAAGILLPTSTIYANNCSGRPYTLPSGRKVTAPGKYTDTIRNIAGCDSLVIITQLSANTVATIRKFAIVTVCAAQGYTLPSGRVVHTAGTYEDTLRTPGGCDSVTATITLFVNGPVPTAKNDTALCNGSSIMLATTTGNNYSYAWNTGETSPAIRVTNAGLYTVTLNDNAGCTAMDTFTVKGYNPPVVVLDKNIAVCSGAVKTLDAGGAYKNYAWSTGATTPFIQVSTVGRYWVVVTDSNSCSGTDTAVITRVIPSPANFLGADTTICMYNTLQIKPTGTFAGYLWSTGSVSPAITVSKQGTYTLTVVSADSCTGTDNITISQSACAKLFYMPTAFTPNDDGLNDVFRPANAANIAPPAVYRLVIYSRWGQKIFESNDPARGWDGRVNGIKQSNGTFIWVLTYKYDNTEATMERGTVMLIR